jgi:HAD superfamily hydrolase (TIGR01450 family)
MLCDLDGVVWLAHEPIPGSAEAIARVRHAGSRVLFVTNNSSATVEMQEEALSRVGIPAQGDVLTSAAAAAQLLGRGERALVCGGPGVTQALQARGIECVDAAGERDRPDSRIVRCDAVVVGYHRWFDYEIMRVAAAAVRDGARLIATNDDATYPTPNGPIPGGGSIVAAIATASGRVPDIAGKPHAPMAELVRATVGDDAARAAVMIGDRADTDGRFASTIGCRWALVWSGVTSPDEVVQPVPHIAAPNLAAVVDVLLTH